MLIEICCFSRMPQLFTKDIALLQQFFEALCKVGANGSLGNHYCFVLFLLILVPACCRVTTLGFVLQEDPDTRLAVQEALSLMVGAYSSLEGAQRTLMEALVASCLIKVFSVELELTNYLN